MAESNNPAIAGYLRDLAAVINEIEATSNFEMARAGLALIDQAPLRIRELLHLKAGAVRG